MKRQYETWSVKPNNGEVLGRIFERLVLAFEFEWACEVFGGISRHDQKTGTFTTNLLAVGEIVGQHMPVERIDQIYLLIEECLHERWTIHSAVLPVSCGFGKRAEFMGWIPIVRRFSQSIDRAYLDDQLDGALIQLVPFANAKRFPCATDEFRHGLIDLLVDQTRKDKWIAAMEDRMDARDDHYSRLDLIREAVEFARLSEHPSGAFAEATKSLIKLNECSHLESLLREVSTFTTPELGKFVRLFYDPISEDLNHKGSLCAFVDCCISLFRVDPKLDWYVASNYNHLGRAALRLDMLSWWLQCTEQYLKAFIKSGELNHLTPELLKLAGTMHDEQMGHCPNDFWRSYADLMPTPELKSTILAKLAVRK